MSDYEMKDKQYLGEENYMLPQELMVTITLKEYRDLIRTVAKAELYKAQKTEWELRKRIEKLKEENDEMRNTIIDASKELKKDVNTTSKAAKTFMDECQPF